MSTINLIDHFRKLKEVLVATGLSASLDPTSFELEIKGRNRYMSFYPQFSNLQDRRFLNTSSITATSFGFLGWMPYRPLQWPLSQDKLVFKEFAQANGLTTPAYWVGEQVPERDYLFKPSTGSFGLDLNGPWRATNVSDFVTQRTRAEGAKIRGQLFAEQFIQGQIVKAWFWNSRCFFAHVDDFAQVEGNGVSSIDLLLGLRLAASHELPADWASRATIEQCLRFQGHTLASVLAKGERAFFDFRYGRYRKEAALGESSNRLPNQGEDFIEQCRHLGEKVGAELDARFGLPVLFSADAMLDEKGVLHWLELNSNPVMPPEGYRPMLETLFGRTVSPPVSDERPRSNDALTHSITPVVPLVLQ